jgi:hypothetical protein
MPHVYPICAPCRAEFGEIAALLYCQYFELLLAEKIQSKRLDPGSREFIRAGRGPVDLVPETGRSGLIYGSDRTQIGCFRVISERFRFGTEHHGLFPNVSYWYAVWKKSASPPFYDEKGLGERGDQYKRGRRFYGPSQQFAPM